MMELFPDQEEVFKVSDQESFLDLANQAAAYQFSTNPVYHQFCELLCKTPSGNEVVYLPIRFYKSHQVICQGLQPQITFLSSSTTGQGESTHFLADVTWYSQSYLKGFKRQFGCPSNYTFLGLLPSYLERSNSSLIYMVKGLMEASGAPNQAFYLDNFQGLSEQLQHLEDRQSPTILFGVTYALLDFAEQFGKPLRHTKIIETGGMKGRKTEVTREELHQKLSQAFQTTNIYSEYGMTELLSQAWAGIDGRFHPPPWMKIAIYDIADPLQKLPPGKWGRICVTDLANMHSCCFIATDDIGKLYEDGSFEISGRIDHSDQRGCSLLYT